MNTRQRTRLCIYLLILSVSLLTACGGGSSSSIPDTTAPTVISLSPEDGAINVATNSVISISFDEDLDASTLSAGTFSLVGDTPLSGSISYDAASRSVSFTPDVQLKLNTLHTVALTTSITDVAGNALVDMFSLSFTTETKNVLVSVIPDGTSTANAESGSAGPSSPAEISSDGRYVVFRSTARDLIDGEIDNNGFADIFLRDNLRGTTRRISFGVNNNEANAGSSDPDISADGRYIVYESSATNLFDNDTNNTVDIFLYDAQAATTTRITRGLDSAESNADSFDPVISADGRYVAFRSFASNLVADDNNGFMDIFRYDRQTNIMIRISNGLNTDEANGSSTTPDISADGRYIVFESSASNLVANDSNGFDDIFRYDTQTGETLRVSIDDTGGQANNHSDTPSISADGRFVVFESPASNLIGVDNDTNSSDDVFLHDIQNATTTLISMSSNGTRGNADSGDPRISDDNRYVVFESTADNLVGSDDNLSIDIFVRDLQSNITVRVNLDENGQQSPGGRANNPAISANGRYVTFESPAAGLTSQTDTNAVRDIFRVLLPVTIVLELVR